MALKQTPLNEGHRAMGANMVDFGGWDMPVNYGSQIAEHHQVRRDCGMFDVSHMRVVDIKGKGARDFLRYLLANNVDKITRPGKALYSCMLLESGGVVDDLIVYFLEEGWFRLVVNSGTADKDIAWMKQRVIEHATAHPACYAESGSQSETCAEGSAKPGDPSSLAGPPGETDKLPLSIADLPDMAIIAVQGPKAREKLWAAMPGTQRLTENLAPFYGVLVGSMFIARTGYTGEDGFEVMVPAQAAPYFWNSLAAKGVKPCGLGARDTLRLEAGMNLYGHDMDETTSPLEAGLGWTVDLKSERNFIGKAALLANPPARKLVGLVLLDRGVLREHQKVLTKSGDGEITSGTFSPTLERSIAFARVPDDVRIDDVVQVEVRDKILAAKVVKYPFARNGKAVVSY